MAQLEVIYRNIDGLLPYANNARTHSPAQIEQLAASIQEFGFTNPILLDSHGVIIAGHGRVLAAKLLDMSEVPTITLTHLSDRQRRAYILADNRLALNSGWDIEKLANELSELALSEYDLSVIGFDEQELDAMLKADIDLLPDDFSGPKVVVTEHERARHANTKKNKDKPVTVRGDRWLLGDHMLTVGQYSNLAEIDELIMYWQRTTGMKAVNAAGDTFADIKALRK